MVLKTVKNWYFDWCDEPADSERIVAQNLRGAVFRAGILSAIFSVAFPVYGFTILDFLRQFDQSIDVVSNIFPRLLFNSVPLALLSLLCAKSRRSDQLKVMIWMTVFPLVIQAAAWVHVWPMMIKGNSQAFGMVHAANVYVIAVAFITLSPPNRYLLFFVATTTLAFWIPLMIVVSMADDPVLVKVVAMDIVHTTLLNAVGSSMIYRIRVKLSKMEQKRHSDASKFLGETVSNAIFQNRTESLANKKVLGVIAASDIRGYTEMMTKYPQEQVAVIMDAYHALISEAVARHGGFIHKSTGDGHIMTFGVMNDTAEKVDLSDIPGLESEEAVAAANRHQSLVQSAISACKEVMDGLTEVVKHSGLDLNLSVGAAVDFGEIELRTIGNKQHRLEYDIFGRTVIRAARLEGHTKALRKNMFHDASMLILSDEAAQTGDATDSFIRVNTKTCPVRDFPEVTQLWVQLFWPSGKASGDVPAEVAARAAA